MADSQSRLSAWKLSGLSLAVTLGVWLLVSWPLPRYVGAGIPAAAHREAADIQPLVPGDHLQFMYYCWLAGDMVAGKTPLFYNLYEFNTGNDRERFEPYAYYIPFSLIYAAGAWLGGRSFGWNLTGFISLWLTYLLTWLLVRRWTRSEWVAAVAALLGIVLPFRWINLFGGSPAGFAMTWIPAILLGVDLAVREDRVRGGVLAGAALLLASWGDSHVFFFGTLAVPVWGVVAFAGRTDFQWRQGASYRRLVLALLPIGLFAVVALLFPVLMKGLYRAVTALAPVAHAIGPRTLREVMLFAPDWQGFCGINTRGTSAHIYLGVLIPAFITVGWLALVRRAWGNWRTHGRTLIVLVLMLLAMVVIMFLALGPRGPEHGLLFRICRLIIPPYAMIRQPAKIFCLMPSFLAVASAITLTALIQLRAGRAWFILVPIVFAGLILWDYPRQSNPTISLLEKNQGAYAAVAADAAAGQAIPRALVLPLWPGDSHYASVYQYFASIYRVRMVNGYNPFIKQGYFENVFRRFESVNQGGLSEDQVKGLLGMHVRYILLHENLFPEKVSPFPVTATLQQLLRHPRLELLCQDGSVWAFKIMDSPRTRLAPAWDILIPARRFEMEKTIAERRVTVVLSPEAGGRAFVALEETNASLRTTPIRVASVSNLHWLVRVRGQGTLGGELMTDERVTTLAPLKVQAEEWTWLNLSVPAFRGFAVLSLKLVLQAGAVDLDLSLLTAGPWHRLNPGESMTLPAPLFFHAGYTDLKSGGVVFRRDYDPQGFVLYGPKLPLPRGTYEINIAFTSPAAPGIELGVINLEQNEAAVEGVGAARPASVILAGRPASVRWRQYENLPFNLALHYNAASDLEIQRITIKRLK
ncbi:MAG: hypothetical protein L6437_15015 [Kiritimatiellae bacterium]|nr:hypothetical protein [Verrucomicrobiota bacterium]MBU4286312.1 hypothetical protein [Verrucomicrobiota bacterium]MBU4365614.1 hypothetical protein [Verrucomicrobiota bacterium]MCG2661543.1 hypothetical protein [Kiritimatiellia bacterium]